MNTALKTLLTGLLLTGASKVMAASSVDLTVRGLITPSACAPALSNAGVYDLGKLSAKDLNADTPTGLPAHILQLTLTCEAATLLGLEARDNREGSDYNNDTLEFGLGLINGTEKLGAMTLRTLSPVADGVPARTIGSYDGGLTWNVERNFMRDNMLSVADTSTLVPLPVTLFSSDLSIGPTIAPTNGLTLNNEVSIDGSVTLTVKYL